MMECNENKITNAIEYFKSIGFIVMNETRDFILFRYTLDWICLLYTSDAADE